MSAEVQAARERLRRLNAGAGINVVYPDLSLGYGPINDRSRLADNDLAEHPADDSTALSEEWLRSVGFTSDHGVGWLYDFVIEQRDGWEIFLRLDESSDWEVQVMQSPIGHVKSDGLSIPTCHPKTRGDLRRLCRALGITLKENHHA